MQTPYQAMPINQPIKKIEGLKFFLISIILSFLSFIPGIGNILSTAGSILSIVALYKLSKYNARLKKAFDIFLINIFVAFFFMILLIGVIFGLLTSTMPYSDFTYIDTFDIPIVFLILLIIFGIATIALIIMQQYKFYFGIAQIAEQQNKPTLAKKIKNCFYLYLATFILTMLTLIPFLYYIVEYWKDISLYIDTQQNIPPFSYSLIVGIIFALILAITLIIYAIYQLIQINKAYKQLNDDLYVPPMPPYPYNAGTPYPQAPTGQPMYGPAQNMYTPNMPQQGQIHPQAPWQQQQNIPSQPYIPSGQPFPPQPQQPNVPSSEPVSTEKPADDIITQTPSESNNNPIKPESEDLN